MYAFPVALSETLEFDHDKSLAIPMSIWVQVISKARPSRAVHFVSPVIACFEVVYGDECGRGTCAEREPLLMTRPIYKSDSVHVNGFNGTPAET